MKKMIAQLFTSKKFVALLAGLLAMILVRKLGLDEATANQVSMQVVALVGVFIGAQGVADMGKEAKKVELGK